MTAFTYAPAFAAVIVAAGQGLRAGQPVPKQFALLNGKPVVRRAAEALIAAGCGPIAVAIPDGAQDIASQALAGLPDILLRIGGATRQESVRLALEALIDAEPEIVLIHDAARPDCPSEVIERLLHSVKSGGAAIPALPVVDSLAINENGFMMGSAERDALQRVQTPQAFRYPEILAAHRSWEGELNAGDDAQVAKAAGIPVALVAGDERLRKLTFAADFPTSCAMPRVGFGYDVHRLAAGEELWLCGIRVPHGRGLAGHSDADVALHALVDAILGACGAGDIGLHFPPSDPQWRGAPSSRFVEHAVGLAGEAGFGIGNVDVTIICEAPKIGPYRDAMRTRIASLLDVGISAVNIKATTTERLGFAGRGEGIAAQAVAMLVPLERT